METILQEIFQQWEVIKAFFAFDTARLAEPDMIVRLGIQVLLLCSSAFFSGSETALFSLSRLDLQKLRRERNRHTETLHALMDQPRRLIISILCGNELVNIAAAANMTGILVVLYGVERAGWISVLVMVPLLLLFGEVTPKTISVSNPVRVSTGMVATPMSMWVKLVAPLVWVIRSLADRPVHRPAPVYSNGKLRNDPSNPYWGHYAGDEDTYRKPAYHNGTAWTWPFPSYAEALVMVYGDPARDTALSILASASDVINSGCLRQSPEVIDGNTPHIQRGCGAQAWGVTELYRMVKTLNAR